MKGWLSLSSAGVPSFGGLKPQRGVIAPDAESLTLRPAAPFPPGFVFNELSVKKIIARDYLYVKGKIIERDNLFLDAGSLRAYASGL